MYLGISDGSRGVVTWPEPCSVGWLCDGNQLVMEGAGAGRSIPVDSAACRSEKIQLRVFS